jgi:hypothetical protein
MARHDRFRRTKDQWALLTYYQRFESLVAVALTLIIGMIVLVALYRLIISVVVGLVFGALNPLDDRIFRAIFGEIMTLLIALEFNHTLQYVVRREQSIVQTKVVLLIALRAGEKIHHRRRARSDCRTAPWSRGGDAPPGMSYWLIGDFDERKV